MFHGWDNFFLTTGPSAGSLIGLLFVVITLTAGRDRDKALRGAALLPHAHGLSFRHGPDRQRGGVGARGLTPTQTALALGFPATYSVGYTLVIGVRLWRADGNVKPHWSDVWMYGVTPPVVYLLLLGSTTLEFVAPKIAPYGVAVMLLALLFMGIRNAWDLVTWMAPMVGKPFPNGALGPATIRPRLRRSSQ